MTLLDCTNAISSHKLSLNFYGVQKGKGLDSVQIRFVSHRFKPAKTTKICSFHRSTLGTAWVRTSTKCSVPRSVARHKSKPVKGERYEC